jgi:hypothetical protein
MNPSTEIFHVPKHVSDQMIRREERVRRLDIDTLKIGKPPLFAEVRQAPN